LVKRGDRQLIRDAILSGVYGKDYQNGDVLKVLFRGGTMIVRLGAAGLEVLSKVRKRVGWLGGGPENMLIRNIGSAALLCALSRVGVYGLRAAGSVIRRPRRGRIGNQADAMPVLAANVNRYVRFASIELPSSASGFYRAGDGLRGRHTVDFRLVWHLKKFVAFKRVDVDTLHDLSRRAVAWGEGHNMPDEYLADVLIGSVVEAVILTRREIDSYHAMRGTAFVESAAFRNDLARGEVRYADRAGLGALLTGRRHPLACIRAIVGRLATGRGDLQSN